MWTFFSFTAAHQVWFYVPGFWSSRSLGKANLNTPFPHLFHLPNFLWLYLIKLLYFPFIADISLTNFPSVDPILSLGHPFSFSHDALELADVPSYAPWSFTVADHLEQQSCFILLERVLWFLLNSFLNKYTHCYCGLAERTLPFLWE